MNEKQSNRLFNHRNSPNNQLNQKYQLKLDI
jgi:hypothetical protein